MARATGASVAIVIALLIASCPLLPGRGGDDALPPPPAAAPPFSPRSAAPVLVVRVYANAARDDEFVELANPGDSDVDLGSWSITDQEDRAAFPQATWLRAHGSLVTTRNATSYAEDTRRAADFTWDRGDGPRTEGGVLRLADAGDEVLLCDPSGAVVDAYVYGSSTYGGPGWTGGPASAPSRGEVATRAASTAGWEDHDDASDWKGLRAYRLGQSSFDPAAVEVASEPQVVRSPDDGRGQLLSFLTSAGRTIETAVYTLTSDAIAWALAERARAGVRVRVLLEGSPVGGVDDDETRIIGALLDAGVAVRMLSGGLDAVKRYRYLHAKYAIVDGAAVFISSENFGDSGFPRAGEGGNRGWSVIVDDLALARQLWEVFEEDFDPSRADSLPAAGPHGATLAAPEAILPRFPTRVAGSRWMHLIVAPDTALADDGVLRLIATAEERIWIEAFYADDPWGDAPNPLLEAAFAAARRGVSVRILLDGSGWTKEEDTTANDALAAILNERADREGLELEVRVFTPTGSVERIHNKGMVVDGRAALVSSMNWAHGSVTDNREVGLILEDRDVAALLEDTFLADWEGRPSAPADDVLVSDPATLLGLYAFIAAASAASLRKMRRRDKGLKRPRRMVLRGFLGTPLRRRRREVRVLSPELVAEPGDGAGRGARDRGGREEAHGGRRGPEGDRGP